ncbi:MAG: GNAT family N-acetyltransferase [Anaerolineales bacterium]
MDFDTVPTSDFPVSDLAKLLNQGFEEYIVPIHFNTDTFLNMLRKDGIDLTASCVLIVDDQPCGIALIARRGWTSRLAAMGIAKEIRGKGVGSWFMEELVKEAIERGDHEMVLEVIEQNEPAVKLYQRSGFQTIRRLIGFTRMGSEAGERKTSDLREVDLRDISRLVAQHGLSDLPWQISGESIAQMNPPARGYEKNRSYIVVSNPVLEHVAIWSLLVEQAARRRGLATDLLKTVMANHAGKTWHVPAIFPEEFGRVFEKAGFEREQLSQRQMKLKL